MPACGCPIDTDPRLGLGERSLRRRRRGGARRRVGLTLAALTLAAATSWALPARGASTGRLVLSVVDRETQKPLYCRMHLVGANNKPRRADKAPFWFDHFVVPGTITLKLPVGEYAFVLERGPEYLVREGHFTINPLADDTQTVDLKRFFDMAAGGWYSGDLFVRRPPQEIEAIMLADDLHLAEVITWGNGRGDAQKLRDGDKTQVNFDGNRCYNLSAGRLASAGTELLLFNASTDAVARLLRAATPSAGSSPADLPPLWPQILAPARAADDGWIDLTAPFWWDLPLLVAHGTLDSIEVAHRQFGRTTTIDNEADGRPRDRFLYPPPRGMGEWSHDIYFRLLDAGVRLPPTAGSGSGIAPNPIGYNRVYAHIDGEFSRERWWEAVRAGQVVVSNGPLLQPSVEGQPPGYTFHAERGATLDLQIGLTLSTREPISYLEIVQDGRVAKSLHFDEYAKTGRLPPVHFDHSGWFLIRAVTDLNKTHRFAMTGPYFVEIGYEKRISREAAQFFLDWVDLRAKQFKLDAAGPDATAAAEYIDAARQFWQDRLKQATAD